MANNDVEYTAKLSQVRVVTGNRNLDGTGTTYSVISGSGKGVQLSRVYVKSTGDSSQGVVRLFLSDGVDNKLVREISVVKVDQRDVTSAFSKIVKFSPKLVIPNGFSLIASTEKTDSFILTAEGLEWNYPRRVSNVIISSSVSSAVVSTANSNLDGTGTLGSLISGTNSGTRVNDITIKSTGDVTEGMIRLFIFSGGASNNMLFMEIPVESREQTAVEPSFNRTVRFHGGLMIPSGYQIKVSTENSDSFVVTANAYSWGYK